jgi:hypothetical protein
MICSETAFDIAIFGTTAIGFWTTATADTFVTALYGLGVLGIAFSLSYQANQHMYKKYED